MQTRVAERTFPEQIREQLAGLRGGGHGYRALRLHIAGVSDPWEFGPNDDFEFHEGAGVLIVRDGPVEEGGNDNAEVPEYVFRLDAVVASQLV